MAIEIDGALRSEAHIWCLDPESLEDPFLLNVCRDLMSVRERQRELTFRFAKHRNSFVLTRALVRIVLSKYAAVHPRDWTFADNPYGRPEIVEPVTLSNLRFSVSHTEGLIVCAVTIDREIGVDVENLQRQVALIEIGERFFSPSESADLLCLSGPAQRLRFFEYWTLKESYIKARGMGLSIALDQFSFQISDTNRIQITFAPQFIDDPANWQFAQLRPGHNHLLAIAVRRASGPQVAIRLRQAVLVNGTQPILLTADC